MSPENGPEQEPTRDEQLWAEAHGLEDLYELLVVREAASDSIAEQGGLHNIEEAEREDFHRLQKEIRDLREQHDLDPYE